MRLVDNTKYSLAHHLNRDKYRKLSFTFTGVYQTCALSRSKMVHRIASNEDIF